jgi:hypothetical protein
MKSVSGVNSNSVNSLKRRNLAKEPEDQRKCRAPKHVKPLSELSVLLRFRVISFSILFRLLISLKTTSSL